MIDHLRLHQQRVLITGAASGIGLAIAHLFAEEGAALALIDHNEANLSKQTDKLSATGIKLTSASADVADPVRVGAAVKQCGADLGGLDCVINSAGIDLEKPFGEQTPAEWRKVLDINLNGPAWVCQAALPALREAEGGVIINIASGAALRPLAKRTAYCAAKAGLVMLTKTLALELAPLGIRANAICPGAIDTPMLQQSLHDTTDLAKIQARYALGRVGQAQDIAHAALYLASPEAAFVTGSALAVDGGRAFH